MAAVVFVHGTGVRGERYAAQFERVRTAIARRRPKVRVLPCRWGDGLGAALHADGASIPEYEPGEGRGEEYAAEREWRASQWRLLDADPQHELRMIAASARSGESVPFVVGAQPQEAWLVDRVRWLIDDPRLAEDLSDLGLLEEFDAAASAVLDSASTQEALRVGSVPELAQALARAFVAEALRRAGSGPQGPVPVIESSRGELVDRVVDLLGGTDLGVGSVLAKSTAMVAWRWVGAGVVERRRGTIVDGAHPMAGDILLYLSRGERIRRFIASCCRDVEPPVVLVAHSLGGIACLDLLATHEIAGIERLVTVGSQAPLLYELDALPSLAYGEPLPASVPAWTNVYDPRDLLAYVGEKVFPGRVVDVPVPSGNPFPFAHSDYFGNPAFYDVLEEVLP